MYSPGVELGDMASNSFRRLVDLEVQSVIVFTDW